MSAAGSPLLLPGRRFQPGCSGCPCAAKSTWTYWLQQSAPVPISITGVIRQGLQIGGRPGWIEAWRTVWEAQGNTVHAAIAALSPCTAGCPQRVWPLNDTDGQRSTAAKHPSRQGLRYGLQRLDPAPVRSSALGSLTVWEPR